MKKITAMVACGIMAVLILGTLSGHIGSGLSAVEDAPAEADIQPTGSEDTPPPDGTAGRELDRYIRQDPDGTTAMLTENENDMNSHTDAGNNIYGAFPVYPGEPEDKAPGRGTEGQLDPSGDSADWYYFSVQAGMTIEASISAFEMELIDSTGETTLASGTSFSATAETTGNYFIRAYTPDGASAGSYDLEITVSGQNDAGTGSDAGNSMSNAASISPGS
ncbi:MAG: hypothetical protein KGY55_02055, partial [Candidatus Thermoplasmatota archaeon]|nr:hypothetical protein [Candidatus Thermoplasmatota archaeon]